MTKEEILHGIRCYSHQQKVLRKLIGRHGEMSEELFDRIFMGIETRKPRKARFSPVYGDCFVLGLGINGGTMWAEYLEILQYMVSAELVDAYRRDDGLIYYRLSAV